MLRVVVASSKGGCGKTTIATNLAAYYALHDKNTVLVDTDRQGSSQRWCEKRVGFGAPVLPVSGTRSGWQGRIPADAQRVIIDAPAGIRASELSDLLDDAQALLIPVLPSRIDMEASEAFLADVADLPKIKRGKVAVGLVANRMKPWTTAAQQAIEELRQLPFPVVGQLRDTQGYVLMTGLGKSIFDYHSEAIRSHQEDWEKLIRWLKKAA